ncbi:MAG TPA: ABC transporter ATP-binding protein [Candidatus Polarisedimenticolia bacterium]|jgi:putative ABC transport system ATP-binding protein|nr:ABC transporter ATP-binding protein [Candidatus Polarisedimenticolia bacterium]
MADGVHGRASPMVEALALVKTYPLSAETVTALGGVDLTISAGELVALVGASGSGKTTLLNLLGCLDRPTSGTVRILGTEVQDLGERELTDFRRRRIGFVFQEAFLIPTLTTMENVGLPLAFDRSGAETFSPGAILEQVGLAGKSHRYPSELSGGERQRVAIARALVHRPALLLADEPTGNLDSDNGRKIFALFRELVGRGGLAALVATHNLELAALADRRLYLKDGRISTEVA